MNLSVLLGWILIALGLRHLITLVTERNQTGHGFGQSPFAHGAQGVTLVLFGATFVFPQWVPVPYEAPFCRPAWIFTASRAFFMLAPAVLALTALIVARRSRQLASPPPPQPYTSAQRRATIIGLLLMIGFVSFVCFVWQPRLWSSLDNPDLEQVRLTSPTEGWALAQLSFSTGRIYQLQNGQWAPASADLRLRFTDIDLLNADTGWITTSSDQIFRLTNGVWTAQPAPAESLNAVAAVAADEAWVAGDEAFFHWRNNAWTAVPLPQAHLINDLVMLGPDTGWAVGGSVYDEQSGVMFQYANGAWREVAIPTRLPLLSISMLPDGTGWAVGGTDREPVQQVVLHYDGAAWRAIPSPTALPLKQVVALEPERFWAIAGGFFPVPLNCPQSETIAPMHTIVAYDTGAWRELSAPIRRLNGIAALPGDEVRLAADDRILRYTSSWWQMWQVDQRFTR